MLSGIEELSRQSKMLLNANYRMKSQILSIYHLYLNC